MHEDYMSEDDWYAAYHPILAADGGIYWTADEVAGAEVPGVRVWSAIDLEDGRVVIMPGMHRVNRVGLAVTRNAHHAQTRSVVILAGPLDYGVQGVYTPGGEGGAK